MPTETRYTRPACVVETGYTLASQTLETGYTRAALAVETGYDAQPAAPTAPVNSVAPVVSGITTEGETLSCTDGVWTGTLPITYTYQWYRVSGPTLIGGATSSTYLLDVADVGEDIFCIVGASNVAGSDSIASNNVGPIASAGIAPVNTVAPVASGTVRIGQTLTCTTGTWTGTPTPTYAYQWRRDGADIGGATASTHTVVSADIAAEMDCVVTATNASGSADEPSNTLTSVHRDILLILGADGYLWIFDPAETGVSAGSPLASVLDVTGTQALVQPTSTRQPTQQAGRAEFATDDWMQVDGLASYFASGDRSMMVVLQTAINTSVQIVFSATRIGFASPQWTMTAQGRTVGPATGAQFASATLPATKPVWIVDKASGGAERQIDTTVTTASSLGTSGLIDTVTLGARLIGSSGGYLTDGVRCLILVHREITSGERATIRSVLDAQGVTTP